MEKEKLEKDRSPALNTDRLNNSNSDLINILEKPKKILFSKINVKKDI
jgi:hypothetical protein